MDDDFTLLKSAVAAHFKLYAEWQNENRDKPFPEALGNLVKLQKQFSQTLDGVSLKTERGHYARCDLQKLLETDVKATEQFAQDQRFENSTLRDVYHAGKANEKGMESFVRLTLNGSLIKAQRMSEAEAKARMQLECTDHPALAMADVQADVLMALAPAAPQVQAVDAPAGKTHR